MKTGKLFIAGAMALFSVDIYEAETHRLISHNKICTSIEDARGYMDTVPTHYRGLYGVLVPRETERK